jgi:hypothetical protein
MADEQPKFNPAAYMRQLRGRGGQVSDYLDVKFRLVWLRSEHPEAQIETDLKEGGIESNYAVFKALVSIPGGGSATGWGSETKSDFGDFLEKAETKALGRALIALGYGAADVAADEVGDPAPSDQRAPARPRQEPSGPAAPQPLRPREAERFTPPARLSEDPPQPYTDSLNWTDFWAWAKPRGYKSKHDLAVALGKTDDGINGWTPAEIRTAIEVAIKRASETALPAGYAG